MAPREVTDPDTGITWSCVQAFAGLGGTDDHAGAARVKGAEDRFHVVCTPTGGAKSVRLELPGDWDTALPDTELLAAIRGGMSGAA